MKGLVFLCLYVVRIVNFPFHVMREALVPYGNQKIKKTQTFRLDSHSQDYTVDSNACQELSSSIDMWSRWVTRGE